MPATAKAYRLLDPARPDVSVIVSLRSVVDAYDLATLLRDGTRLVEVDEKKPAREKKPEKAAKPEKPARPAKPSIVEDLRQAMRGFVHPMPLAVIASNMRGNFPSAAVRKALAEIGAIKVGDKRGARYLLSSLDAEAEASWSTDADEADEAATALPDDEGDKGYVEEVDEDDDGQDE